MLIPVHRENSCSIPFSARERGRALTPFTTYIPEKIIECWLVETDGILLLTMGVFLVSRGIITDPDWVKVASQRSVLSQIRWWMNIPLIFSFTCIFQNSLKLSPWVRDSGDFERTLKLGVKLVLYRPQAHGSLYSQYPWCLLNVRGAKRGVNWQDVSRDGDSLCACRWETAGLICRSQVAG